MMMTRKQFLGSLAGLFGVATLAACSSSDDDGGGGSGGGGGGGGGGTQPDAGTPMADASTPSPDAPPAGTCQTPNTASISANHGHSLTVPPGDLDAGTDRTYNIQGSSGHPHSVTITAAMFATLKANRTLQVTSTNNAGHTHNVTVTC